MTDEDFVYGSTANLFGSDVSRNPVKGDVDQMWASARVSHGLPVPAVVEEDEE